MLKCILVNNPIKYNTHSFLLTRLVYTAILSVKKVSWEVYKVQQHGVLLPQIYNIQL